MPPTPATSSTSGKGALSTNKSTCSDSENKISLVDDAYNIIHEASQGKYPPLTQYEFELPQSLFFQLLDNIEKRWQVQRFFSEKMRFNWKSGKLVLLFLSQPFHETVSREFKRALYRELSRLITTYPSLQSFQGKLVQLGATPVKELNDDFKPLFWRSPDGQLTYKDGDKSDFRPSLVFDIRWSYGDLREAAQDYFRQFPDQVSTYLGIEIGYEESKKLRSRGDYRCAARLHLWNVSWSESGSQYSVYPLVEGAMFRDEAGNAVPGCLYIPFYLMVPPGMRERIPPDVKDVEFSFDFKDLAAMIDQGEKQQRKLDSSPLASDLESWKRSADIVFYRRNGTIEKVIERGDSHGDCQSVE